MVQLAICIGKNGCAGNIDAYADDNIPNRVSTFNKRHLNVRRNSVGLDSNGKQIQKRINRPFIASPEKAQTPVCTSCYSRGMGCLLVMLTFTF